MDPKEIENTKPLEEVAPISIHPDYLDRHVMIKYELTEKLLSALVEVLKKNYDVFAWSLGNVPRINLQVSVHKLFTDPDQPLIRQKRRKFAPKCMKVIEEEVAKLIKANAIRETHYPDWLANVVVAPKKEKSGKCVLISLISTRPA